MAYFRMSVVVAVLVFLCVYVVALTGSTLARLNYLDDTSLEVRLEPLAKENRKLIPSTLKPRMEI